MKKSENQNIIILKDLSIGYSEKVLAAKINLQICQGKMVALMGANGSGKSTLIKTLMGLLPKLGGEILLHNKNLEEFSMASRALEMAVVLTDPILTRDLSVFETVSYGRYPHTSWLGRLKQDDVDIIHKSIADVGLSGFDERKINSLSDGELQRVMIAKGLAQQTAVMILDEPTSHLDIRNRMEVINLLKSLTVERGITIIFSTHELDLVKRAADDVWLFDRDGRVRCGSPNQFLQQGDFKEVFGEAAVYTKST